MSKETFTIPAGPTAQHEFATSAVKMITTNATAWNIPATEVTTLTELFTDYDTKYAVTNNRSTQSPAATAARNDSWETLGEKLDYMYGHYLLNNDAIASADKEALHIHALSGGGGSSPAPVTTPVITFTSEGIGALYLNYSDSSAPGTHYKPDNVAFCELRYTVGAAAPATPAECTEGANVSRSHTAIQFAPEQRGKAVYAFARWVNRNGKTGPWSAMATALVP